MRIFTDTTSLSYASESKVQQSRTYGEGKITTREGVSTPVMVSVPGSVVRPPNLNSSKVENEFQALRQLAEMVCASPSLKLFYSQEVAMELAFQPLIPRLFFGAPISMVQSPLDLKPDWSKEQVVFYSAGDLRSGVGGADQYLLFLMLQTDWSDNSAILNFRSFAQQYKAKLQYFENLTYKPSAANLLYPVLKKLDCNRYRCLLSNLLMSGSKETPNMLLDAFLLLTAEQEGCDVFLTHDEHLKESYEGHLAVLSARELMGQGV